MKKKGTKKLVVGALDLSLVLNMIYCKSELVIELKLRACGLMQIAMYCSHGVANNIWQDIPK